MSGDHNMYTSKITYDSPPRSIKFSNINSEWIMQITHDRKILVNENVEVNKAAQKVLDALQGLLNKSKPQYRELSDEEIEELREYHGINDWLYETSVTDFARAILKKAKR